MNPTVFHVGPGARVFQEAVGAGSDDAPVSTVILKLFGITMHSEAAVLVLDYVSL